MSKGKSAILHERLRHFIKERGIKVLTIKRGEYSTELRHKCRDEKVALLIVDEDHIDDGSDKVRGKRQLPYGLDLADEANMPQTDKSITALNKILGRTK